MASEIQKCIGSGSAACYLYNLCSDKSFSRFNKYLAVKVLKHSKQVGCTLLAPELLHSPAWWWKKHLSLPEAHIGLKTCPEIPPSSDPIVWQHAEPYYYFTKAQSYT